MDPIVIIGTGLAGYTVAKAYRKIKNDEVMLVSRDDGAFYSKPMLSNGFAFNKTAVELATASATKMAETHDIRVLKNTTINAIKLSDKKILTARGDLFAYRQLVLATGANPRPLKVDPSVEKKVFHVNSLQDYALFREALEKSKRIAIIGTGLIGCEFANDLIMAGYSVDVMGPNTYPLSALVPECVGNFLKQALSSQGVKWHLQTKLESMQNNETGIQLKMSNGSIIEADIVLSAIGLRPNSALAEKAGIKVNRGIVVDEFLRTSAPDVYALGDCAEVEGQVLPFILPLMTAARALAKTLAVEDTRLKYPVMPVVVKTPASPLVICTPLKNTTGNERTGRWHFESTESGISARYHNEHDQLEGFCLIGESVSKKQALVKEIQVCG
ncbi:FAD-dependent oxidoreductase [Beggiatoa alba]|nr:FAD-dependent oxidoreductase [Beggiatoa alba]